MKTNKTVTLEQANDLREQAKHLARQVHKAYWELGAMLIALGDTWTTHKGLPVLLYSLWGYSSVMAWARAELGLTGNVLWKCRAVYKCFGAELGNKWDPSTQLLGVTHMYALIKICPSNSSRAHLQHWLGRASALTIYQLRNEIEEALSTGKPPVQKLNVQMTVDEYDTVNRAVLEVMGEVDTVQSAGSAIALIVREWMDTKGAMQRALRKKSA